MYPITFRRVAGSQVAGRQFAKYQIIECQASKPSKGDYRPESLRIDQDTITLVGDPLPSVANAIVKKALSLVPAPSK
jgi:hypothetical protein